jgi:hypothetical protein
VELNVWTPCNLSQLKKKNNEAKIIRTALVEYFTPANMVRSSVEYHSDNDQIILDWLGIYLVLHIFGKRRAASHTRGKVGRLVAKPLFFSYVGINLSFCKGGVIIRYVANDPMILLHSYSHHIFFN